QTGGRGFRRAHPRSATPGSAAGARPRRVGHRRQTARRHRVRHRPPAGRLGASLVIHHYAPHDRDQPWGADPGGLGAVIGGVTEALADPDAAVWHQEADLSDPDSPSRLVESAAATSRFLDILVCNHARSGGDGPLGTLTAGTLDAHWAVNTRASILLAQAFAARHDDSRPGGRIVFMTSGQDLGPMPGEVAYAASKGALASIVPTLADQP